MEKLGYGYRGNRSFANEIGVSDSFLGNVLKVQSGPSVALIKGISEHFPNVNVRWLLTGEGEWAETGIKEAGSEYGKSENQQLPLNTTLLKEIIEVVELVLGKHGLVLGPPDKAEAVTVLYEMYLDSGKKPEERTTERMLRLVA